MRKRLWNRLNWQPASWYKSATVSEHVFSVFLQQMNRALWPDVLLAVKPSGLPGREIFLTVQFPFRRSLLTSQRQCGSVPERRGSSRSAEVYAGITFRWSVSRRTGARHRADGCVVWPDGGQLEEDRRTNGDGQVGVTRVAVRWKAAAEDSGLASWQRRVRPAPTIMSASLELDHEADQLFQRGESSRSAAGHDCKVYKRNRWVNTPLNNEVESFGYFLW